MNRVLGGRMDEHEAMRIDVPWWLGVANRNPMNRTLTVYPIPLNKVAQWSLRFWLWVRFGWSDDARTGAYYEGYSAGRKMQTEYIFERAYTAGEVAARDSLVREVRDLGNGDWFIWHDNRRRTDKARILGLGVADQEEGKDG